MAFDYRYFGASGGEPRQLVSVAAQLEDYAAAIAFARTLPEVDPERIVVWGTSFSGGHAVAVAVADGRVAARSRWSRRWTDAPRCSASCATAGLGQLAKMTAAGMRDAIGATPPARRRWMLPVVGPPRDRLPR